MTIENEVRKLARLVQELAEISAIQERRILELEAWRDTGLKHKYCPECQQVVRVSTSGASYGTHTYLGQSAICPASFGPVAL